jgi:hypothetical protein
MIAIDAGVLSLLLFPSASVPNDFRTGNPIERARDRINALVFRIEKSGETILIPTPALSEVLVCSSNPNKHLQILQARSCFAIKPFGERAAIEIAIRTRAALSAKDKKEGIDAPWQKVKYDRQIIAISKVEGASVLYSLDEHIHAHAKLWKLPVESVADIAPPAVQEQLFNLHGEETNATQA